MKKRILLLHVFIVAFCFAGICKPGKEKGIVFVESRWSEVLKKAKAEHKYIFLDIYASWCGPCKMLAKQTFTDSRVGEYFNANFVNASFDGEAGDGIKLADQFNVEAYPSLFIIDAEGHLVNSSVGYLTAKDLLKFGRQTTGK